MDIAFYGANALSFTHKNTRLIVDDNLKSLGAKSIIKDGDVALFTGRHEGETNARLVFDSPGEYEVADISIIGTSARAQTDPDSASSATMFKLLSGDNSVLVTGHIYPELSDQQLETIGLIDVLIIPVGGHGYTIDPVGALKLIKSIEPKVVIPTHYDDKDLKFPVPMLTLDEALKELGMEPKEKTAKLHLKSSELSDVTQLMVLEKSK